MTEAFENGIIRQHPNVCRMLQSDKGTEFTNSSFQQMLSKHSIHWYSSNSETKAACAERFIRTFKQKIYRFLTYKNTNRYVDVLQDLVLSYNHTWHRSIAMAPVEMSKENESEFAARLFPSKPKKF